MNKLTYVALDPGKSTGFFLVDFVFNDTRLDIKPVAMLTLDLNGVKRVLDLMQDTPITRVVYEQFNQRYAGIDPTAYSVIAFATDFAERCQVPVTELQPAQAKNFVTDETLKQLGLYIKGTQERHVRDAMRLAVYAAVFKEVQAAEPVRRQLLDRIIP